MKKREYRQMFLGQYHSSIDSKSRLTIPARFHQELANGAYVSQGFDRNLIVLPTRTFEEIYQRVVSMNIADPLARLLLRMILGTASELELDTKGNFLVPKKLREFAGLIDEAVLVGQGDYLELWAPELWSQQEIHLQNVENNAQQFAALDLARH